MTTLGSKKHLSSSLGQVEFLNPLRPNINIQILQTDLYEFP